MVVGSLMLYLGLRVAKANQLSTSDQFIGQFFISGLFNIAYMLILGVRFLIPWWQIGLIFVSTLLVVFTSNKASLKALEAAPNPGMSLAIQKSYVVLTTLFAVVAQGKELTPIKAGAIVMIVLFSLLIASEDKTTNKIVQDKRKWLIFSLLAFFGFGVLSLVETHYVKVIGINSLVLTFYVRLIILPIELINRKRKAQSFSFKHLGKLKPLIILITIGLGHFIFNYCMKEGYRTAPNPGYVSAVNLASIGLVTLLSVVLFKDKITKTRMLGIVGVIVSLAFLYF
jgi:uncharacterized membrane protein